MPRRVRPPCRMISSVTELPEQDFTAADFLTHLRELIEESLDIVL
jgi:hypothetical protein